MNRLSPMALTLSPPPLIFSESSAIFYLARPFSNFHPLTWKEFLVVFPKKGYLVLQGEAARGARESVQDLKRFKKARPHFEIYGNRADLFQEDSSEMPTCIVWISETALIEQERGGSATRMFIG